MHEYAQLSPTTSHAGFYDTFRELMAQKRRAVTRGLPKWGEDLPEDVGQFVVLHG